VQTISGTCMLR